jgi:hypothetical protein
MRTVTLEFLRHGAAHGHLLSPLARYMALCGSHEPADVSVPFDHAELLSRLRALDYTADQKGQEQDQLEATAKLMSDFLAQVPGLVAELADPGTIDDTATHLRIIFNANELAMLPFELANSARAFPGAGQSLALQPQVPLCITREVRRPACTSIQWPQAPRILFAYSSSAGPVPAVEHQKALEAAIEPWLYYYDPADPEERKARIEDHLRILPDVTVEQLLEASASGDYTHIHLLAHGVRIQTEERQRYALALTQPDNSGNKPELVDGHWLATLLRPHVRGHIQNLARPTVVTIAACNAADARIGIGAGSSIAHALHEAGIPLVIGSQFPLSATGSVILTQVLYGGLLAGIDPRLLLIDVRRQLRVRAGKVHDWASLVVYASFPQDLDRQLPRVRVARASKSVEAALNHADQATHSLSKILSGSETPDATSPETIQLLKSARDKLRAAMSRLETVLESPFADKALVYGLLASARKRQAEIFLRVPAAQTDKTHEVLVAVEQSRLNYRKAFEADRSQGWGLVQAMVLTAALDGASANEKDDLQLARLLSKKDAEGEDRQRKAWAYGNLLELRLLCTLRPAEVNSLPSWEETLDELIRLVGPDASEVRSTRRQLQRWVEFFPDIHQMSASAKKHTVSDDWEQATALAKLMFERMPDPLVP